MFWLSIIDVNSDFAVNLEKLPPSDVIDFIDYVKRHGFEDHKTPQIFTFISSTFNLNDYCYRIYVSSEKI